MANPIPGTSKGKEVLVMTIDIGDGRQDTISIQENDDPIDLARNFSAKHHLDYEMQETLLNHIIENIQSSLRSPKNEEKHSDWLQSDIISPSHNETSSKGLKPKKGTVYDRIYQQLKKNNTSVSVHQDLSVSKSSVNFNYGEYLYLKGVQKLEEQKKKCQETKNRELEEADLQELTFSPAINNYSSIKSNRPAGKPEEVLAQKGKEYQEKLEKKKQDLEAEALKECKFQPKINKKLNISRSGGIHQTLYNQAEKLKEKQLKNLEKDSKQYSFKPNVEMTKKKDSTESKEQVFDRLDSTKKQLQEKLESQRKLQEAQEFDPATGQRLFRPKTNKPQEKRQVAAPVWDVLYSQNDSKKKELDKLKLEQEKIVQETSESKKVCEGSDRIFHDFRKRQYEKLFKLFDSDEDGMISPNAIKIDGLDMKKLEILTPFFEDMEKNHENLDFNAFCARMDVVFKGLNVAQRAILLKKDGKAGLETEVERKPAISQNSVALAEKKRKSLPSDMYERLTAVNKMTEMKMQKIKEEKEKELIKECTFKPQLK